MAPIIDPVTGKFKINENMICPGEIYPTIISGAFPFLLNNHLAAHAAIEDPGRGDDIKVTMIVLTDGDHTTAYDCIKMDRLLTESLSKYSDFAIWHSNNDISQ